LFGDKPFTAASLATAGFGPSAEAAETLRTSLEMLGAKDAGSTVARGKVLKAQVGKVAEVDGSEWSVQAKADRKEIMVYSLVRHR
jgi:hypothetical protein